ncbi:MAG: carbohydrate binding family 9 domain-containing protein [Gemmatimonadaceae bacterium]|nr:carbohydrate binding family 9 domain-containing protein [Gemmatimonadaceae bacterium]
MTRSRLNVVTLAALSATAPALAAQSIEAARLTGSSPRLDGRLTEEVWRTALAAQGFLQREPSEGAPALDRTEVRFAYDENALWIGARMYSRSPRDIRALITRRDREGSSEQLIVSLDTHRDKRTAYTFAVTPAGVRIDYFHGGDFEDQRNYDYDPVWEAETAIDSAGWTAEIRIPFTQLRFNPGDFQEWGVNLTRRVPARNEQSYWVLVKRNETGWSSRMAALTGIRGVRPTRRIELLPYVAADSRFIRFTDPADPFARDNATGFRAGGDVKMGIGPNLTLDATINPDFGQVEADPAEVNLSAYETFFSERRPFFVEGRQLFGGQGFYYTRRIGAPPPGRADADYQERIGNTTILGAAKLTGRLPSGLSIGALTALTAEEEVSTYDLALTTFGKAVVAPRTGYAVASVQQEFGRTRSTVIGTVTMVQRALEEGTPLAELLTESAYTASFSSRIRWSGGMYDVAPYVGATHVRGDSMAILRQQRSSRRFWQRPDASHVSVDPSRRSLTGTNFGINHRKLSGKHWLWNIGYHQNSPALEPNDLGAWGHVDNRGGSARITYRETTPRTWHRSYSITGGTESEWNLEGVRTYSEHWTSSNLTLSNFWRVSAYADYEPRSVSDVLTRGGPLMARPANYGGSFELASQSDSRNEWQIQLGAWKDEVGGWSRDIEVDLSFRPGPQWEMRLSPRWNQSESSRQYVRFVDDGPATTFGRRYVFAHVDRSEIAAGLRLNYTFTPRLTLETYLEPFAASGTYHGFAELREAGGLELRVYGTDGTTITRSAGESHQATADGQTFTISDPDFNVRSFRSNAVLRWEWRPGSTMFVVWQQDKSANRELGLVRPGDIFDAFRAKGDTFLAVKVSYWMPLK